MTQEEPGPFDVLVLGSGVAGLSVAVRLAGPATAGGSTRSLGVLTKGALSQSATRWAQGGVAAVLGGDEDSTDLHLADTLGGLPLALEQAAAYLQATGDTLASYLALFRQRQAELLARGEPAGYDKRVTTTWALAFAELEQDGSAAVGLLRFVALLRG